MNIGRLWTASTADSCGGEEGSLKRVCVCVCVCVFIFITSVSQQAQSAKEDLLPSALLRAIVKRVKLADD